MPGARPRPEEGADESACSVAAPGPDRGRVRAVVLRPAAVPVDRVRRAGSAQPTSYRITADFPEAATLAEESDVRVSGVTVGSVKELELPPEGNATRVTIEIEPEFAPIAEDTRAMLRQKTLVGETYIELTPNAELEDPEAAAPVSLGAQGGATDAQASAAEPIPEDGHLDAAQVRDTTQIDDIFNALDEQTASRSSAGRPARRSRSKVAASTSTTRSATWGRSSATPPTSSTCFTSSGDR